MTRAAEDVEKAGRQETASVKFEAPVIGAVRDTLSHVRSVLEIEINASTDNPMVFAESDLMLSGGNFHGQPVSLALDHLGTATCSLATPLSEQRRRISLTCPVCRTPSDVRTAWTSRCCRRWTRNSA